MRARITAVVTILVVVGIAIASGLAYAATASQLHRQTDTFLKQRAAELASGFRAPPQMQGGPAPPGPGDRPGRPAFDPDASIQFLNSQGVAIAGIGNELPVDAADRAVAAGEQPPLIRSLSYEGTEYRMVTAPRPDGAVQVASVSGPSEAVLTRLALQLTLLGIGLAIVAAVLGWLLMRRSLAPLERLTTASERVADAASRAQPLPGAPGTPDGSALAVVDRDDADRGDEIGRLARAIERMLAALALSREQQRRLVQDAAHELRTPLTSLRANAEFLSYADRLSPEDRAAILAALRHETDELSMLFDELVQLAVDPAAGDVQPTRTDLTVLTQAVVERFRRRSGRVVEVAIPDELPDAVVVASLLERALMNLLGNAQKFAPSDSLITVEVTTEVGVDADIEGPASDATSGRNTVWWHVRDEGPGIDEADIDRVFDRFYRSDVARSHQGSGLGLAIVRQVAEQHGGSVFAGSRPTGGADVGFSISITPAVR